MANKRFIADENMPLVEQLFADYGEVIRLPGRDITAHDVQHADALLVRSITKVDAALVKEAKQLGFVGSATIGMDHIDTDYLDQQHIAHSNAAGCNAAAVGDYVLSVLATLAPKMDKPLTQMTVGIVGVGNIGRPLQARLRALGVQVICCDPPRAEAEPDGAFIELDALLAQADVITLHVPLTREGAHPTYHLINEARIQQLSAGKLLINASRGEVVDNQALKQRLRSAAHLYTALDVWENEPQPDRELIELVDLATPHIAGYSYEGKVRGTSMIFDRWRNNGETTDITTLIAPPALAEMVINPPLEQALIYKLIHAIYDVNQDHRMMLEACDELGYFDRLRKHYPLRREIGSTTIQLNKTDLAAKQQLHMLGFAMGEK